MSQETQTEHIGATEFIAHAGITYRQLDYWTRIGVIAPANGSNGSGNRRHYLAEDVPIARLMGQILGAGLNDAGTVRHLAERLLSIGTADMGPVRIALHND